MEECAICKDDYDHVRFPIELECHHIFCKFCILNVFKRDNRCPLCRKEYILTITSKEDHNKEFHKDIPLYIQKLLSVVPINTDTSDIFMQLEVLAYKIYIKLMKIVKAIYSPSIRINLPYECTVTFSIHSAFVIFLNIILWSLLYYLY